MSLPKEPRQLMINIMYLVLTALLALNVSAEILKAFSEANAALEQNNIRVKDRLDKSLEMFRQKVKDNDGKGKKFLATAEETNTYIDAQYEALEKIKLELIEYSGGYIIKTDKNTGDEIITNDLKFADNKDRPTRFLVKGYQEKSISSEPGNLRDPRGPEIRNILESSRNYILDACPSQQVREEFTHLLPIRLDSIDGSSDEDIEFDQWSMDQFYQLPTIAAVSVITRFQNELRSSEALLVEKLAFLVTKGNVIFDSYDAAVIPNGTKFYPGDKLVLESFLTAAASKSKPEIRFNGVSKGTSDGKAIYEKVLSDLGKKKVEIVVKSRTSLGKMEEYKKTFEYEVVAPPDHMAVASADATKVLYIGVDNPITAGISGINDNDVKVSMTGGTLSPVSSGKYMARVNSPGTAELTLSGPKADGSGDYVQQVEFRVKEIPNPIALLGADPDNNRGGSMKKAVFKVQEGIKAHLDNFLFNVNFEIVSYEVTCVTKKNGVLTPTRNNGGRFNAQVKSWRDAANRDDVFYFDNIKAKGPDGRIRDLGSLAYTIR